MPRSPRIEYAGAVYHVMSRGVRRENIFRNGGDEKLFMSTLEEALDQTGWLIHAYVLMGNHYHLLLETPEPNLSLGMQWLQGTYAKRFKVRHSLIGPVFNNRFKSLVIQSDDSDYFRCVADYIHLNPARANLLDKEKPVLRHYKQSSFPYYIGAKRKRPNWLECRRVLEGYPRVGDTGNGRELYRKELEESAQMCVKGEVIEEREWRAIRRGWYLGGEGFKDALEERLSGALNKGKRSSYKGKSAQRHDELEAERLIKKSLKALGIDDSELKLLRKKDTRKQGVAWLLKRHTAMGDEWISSKLKMGSRTNIFVAVKVFETGSTSKTLKKYRRLLESQLVNN